MISDVELFNISAHGEAALSIIPEMIRSCEVKQVTGRYKIHVRKKILH